MSESKNAAGEIETFGSARVYLVDALLKASRLGVMTDERASELIGELYANKSTKENPPEEKQEEFIQITSHPTQHQMQELKEELAESKRYAKGLETTIKVNDGKYNRNLDDIARKACYAMNTVIYKLDNFAGVPNVPARILTNEVASLQKYLR